MKAFPKTGSIEFCDPQTGMDLRDYFAAKALPVLLNADSKRWEGNHEFHAEQAYKFADAMMEARKK